MKCSNEMIQNLLITFGIRKANNLVSFDAIFLSNELLGLCQPGGGHSYGKKCTSVK